MVCKHHPLTKPKTNKSSASPALDKRVCQAILHPIELKNNTHLPDPFTFVDGSKVNTIEDWDCRREELSSLYQIYELGTLPDPPSTLTATLGSKGNFTIFASQGDLSISWSVQIVLPTTGDGPFPAVITYGGATIPIPDNIATINFDNSDFAQQNDLTSRGVGTFFDLFPSDHNASALIAWTWGVSRIIDALEITPAANINTKKIALTGCSRDGKGALVAGAFEERLALTIPQESGSGGSACWRISEWQLQTGQLVQTASEIVDENVWESISFVQFQNNTNLLPFDHHELAGMVAPRGLLVIDNPDYLWLGPESCFGCMEAGRLIYGALGVKDSFGFSSVGNHSHCDFPDEQIADLNAFFDRFLLDEGADTDVFFATQAMTSDVPDTYGNFSLGFWADWEVPKLG